MCVLMSVCTGERATAPAWAGEHEFLWFWCHVCLFARAYLRISSCPLRSGRSCVRLSLVLLCAHVFCPLAVYLYPRGDIYSVFLAQAALTQALLKTGRLFLLPGRRRAVQSPAVPAECLSPAPGGVGGGIPGCRAVQLRAGRDRHSAAPPSPFCSLASISL